MYQSDCEIHTGYKIIWYCNSKKSVTENITDIVFWPNVSGLLLKTDDENIVILERFCLYLTP